MLTRHLKRLRLQLIALSVLWVPLTIWGAFVNAPDDAFLTKESPEVQERMDRECSGSYQQRYDCKNRIAIEVSNHALVQGSLRLFLVLLGPVGAAGYFAWKVTREPKPHAHQTRASKPDDLSWKSAAQAHVLHADNPDAGDDEDEEKIDYKKY